MQVKWRVLCLAGIAACGGAAGDRDAALAADPDAAVYPLPDDGVVSGFGKADTLELATWNIENFPLRPGTPELVADLVASLDLDFIAVQEIEDVASFEELDLRLREHEGLLSEHTYANGSYQKVGYLYRADLLRVESAVLLFENDSYAFPRPPLQVVVTAEEGDSPPVDFIAIVVHLKAGFGGEDRERRAAALEKLEEHVDQLAASTDEDVVLLGDFNEVLDSSEGRDAFAPFLEAPQDYTVHTEALAESGQFSFVPSGALLDHAISTAALEDELSGGEERVLRLHEELEGYVDDVSDHLPVVVTMPIF